MLSSLDREDRLRLMKFVCSFAWADLEIQAEERQFVGRMVDKLGLEADRERIDRWLERPPAPEEVDPTQVPREHRELFLEAIRGLISADNVIDENEAVNLELFEQLLG
jgi:hypothetical protein